MFDKLSQVAEQAAINISRRQFFGRLGRVAMVVTTAAGGLLMLPGDAKAAGRGISGTEERQPHAVLRRPDLPA